MSDDQADRAVDSMIRVTRIIVISLIIGLGFFGGFVLMNGRQPQPNQRPIFTWMLVPIALVCAAVSAIAPRVIARTQCKALAEGRWPPSGQQQYAARTNLQGDEAQLANIYQTTTIIGAALLEGPGFFAWLTHWQTGDPLALAIAVGLMVLLLAYFPRRASVERWMENRLLEIREQRELNAQKL